MDVGLYRYIAKTQLQMVSEEARISTSIEICFTTSRETDLHFLGFYRQHNFLKN